MDRRAFLRSLGLGAAVVAAEPVRRYWQVGAVLAPAYTVDVKIVNFVEEIMGGMNEMGRAAAAALDRAVLERTFCDALYPRLRYRSEAHREEAIEVLSHEGKSLVVPGVRS